MGHLRSGESGFNARVKPTPASFPDVPEFQIKFFPLPEATIVLAARLTRPFFPVLAFGRSPRPDKPAKRVWHGLC